jgi:hypothetical protein
VPKEEKEETDIAKDRNFRVNKFLADQKVKATSTEYRLQTVATRRTFSPNHGPLQPNRWKLHVAFGNNNNTLFRILRLEDTAEGKVYQLNHLTEEEYHRIVTKECVRISSTYVLEEHNILGYLRQPTLTLL